MTETKPVEPAYKRHDYTKMPSMKARPSGDETFTKFGEEINIQDFINQSADATNIVKKIETAGGIERLKAAGTKSEDETVTDRSMNFIQANKMIKIMQIKEQKLQEQKIREEQIQKALNEANEEPKGE